MLMLAGYLIASLIACAASLFCLIGTQGLHGNEPFLSVFLPIFGLLVVANGIPAAIGLIPVYNQRGVGAWRAGMYGFLGGALIEAAMFGAFIGNIFTIPLPAVCGGLSVILYGKKRTSAS